MTRNDAGKPQFLCYGGRCVHQTVPGTPSLQVSRLSFRYPGISKMVLKDVSFEIKDGEKTALAGPNGAGKSTLMKLILGLEKIQSGSIKLHGYDAHTCRHKAAMIPQRSTVDWNFPVTVRQVVIMGRYVHLGWFRRPGKKDKEMAEQAMETMRITDLADRQIGELSGGQQQRDADLLLLDEPLNHVDAATQNLMFQTIDELCRAGKSVIISTHDPGLLSSHFDRVLFLDRALIADGKAGEVLTPENMEKAYGAGFSAGKGDHYV